MRIATDKKLHFSCCMLIALVVTLFFSVFSLWYTSAATGLLTAIGTGVGKEYGDSKAVGNKWDWYDILADSLGAIVGSAIGVVPMLLYN